ncbi:phage tail assembly chaperone [Pseudomonas sp. LS1212]|uniref:phage tail assembly chaperone n=1 Tax=Pseudomonas sp. LS1212 TaxID=2972478 RepID=UPI00215C0610|nr:phage tail assembly chaperone [Pseudomonas sp. LS1212]UVJ45547.1 phage tail assembly chaperone [Pseudomonas sp. LS1212]
MMKALIQDGLVVGFATGDSLGEPIPADLPVGFGWRFEDGEFIPAADQPISKEALASAERAWRDGRVDATEWLVTRHRDEQDLQRETTLTPEQFTELLTYRQALRDWPQTETFPDAQNRPVEPPWIAEQTQ